MVRAHLEALVHFHESRNPGSPLSLSEMDAGMVAGFERQVAAFEIDIERIEGAAKLSQDKLPADRERIAAGLKSRLCGDDAAIANDLLDRPSSRTHER
jgi:predicted FMN-binding regulatory protein PaiB